MHRQGQKEKWARTHAHAHTHTNEHTPSSMVVTRYTCNAPAGTEGKVGHTHTFIDGCDQVHAQCIGRDIRKKGRAHTHTHKHTYTFIDGCDQVFVQCTGRDRRKIGRAHTRMLTHTQTNIHLHRWL